MDLGENAKRKLDGVQDTVRSKTKKYLVEVRSIGGGFVITGGEGLLITDHPIKFSKVFDGQVPMTFASPEEANNFVIKHPDMMLGNDWWDGLVSQIRVHMRLNLEETSGQD